MESILRILEKLLSLAALVAAAIYVFGKVGADYQLRGRLSRPTAVLQTGYFFVYALSSYLFLDSRFSYISVRGFFLFLAIALMLIGFLMVVFSLLFLGLRSFGMVTGSLRTSGMYRYSRNPQLVGMFIVIIGYAMLWPSWAGALWVSIWFPISYLMVKAEEAHLKDIFGDSYSNYCVKTPRYIGLLKK